MALPDATGSLDAETTSGPDALIAALESALSREYDALLDRNPDTLIAACGEKLTALQAIAALRQMRPAVITGFRPRLRAAAVANARNQTLLSILRARVEGRVRALGIAGSIYDQAGQRRISVTGRSLSHC